MINGTAGGAQQPRSGLRRLVRFLLLPDALSWAWSAVVAVLVLVRDDVRFSSALAAWSLLGLAILATSVVSWSVDRLRAADADDTTLGPTAIASTLASITLWGCAFGLSILAERHQAAV